MKKIFFLYNNYERERVIIERICAKFKLMNISVFRGGITDKDIVKQLFQVRPHIIFTFPITTYTQIDIYMMAKIFFHSKIITFTTEGLAKFQEEEVAKVFAGFYDYPAGLVDYHTYWGRYAAKYIGRELYQQHKMQNWDQIRVFGNPMYEKDYSAFPKYRFSENVRIKVLVLTGFHGSLYTEQDLLKAQDVVNVKVKSKKEILSDKTFKKYREMTLEEKKYSEKYMQHIIDAADNNPEVLFAIKLHPQEILIRQRTPYKLKYLKRMEHIENIQIIDESIPIGSLLPDFQLLVHYGSTVDLEAYIYKVPTLKLELRNVKNNFMSETNRVTASTYYADIDEQDAISKYVVKLKEGKDLFRKNQITEKQLYAYMNYMNEQTYKPSEQIADFLSKPLKFHRLNLSVFEKLRWMKWGIKNYFYF
ncbi:MAG: hypothetical protein HFH74_07250 [Lachnospiraceae bacterium]|nr:hypothetical protein [Lachnospiraceae bacterium]